VSHLKKNGFVLQPRFEFYRIHTEHPRSAPLIWSVYQHIVFQADWQGERIGSFSIGWREIADALGLTIDQVRFAAEVLRSYALIAWRRVRQGRAWRLIVSIVDYAKRHRFENLDSRPNGAAAVGESTYQSRPKPPQDGGVKKVFSTKIKPPETKTTLSLQSHARASIGGACQGPAVESVSFNRSRNTEIPGTESQTVSSGPVVIVPPPLLAPLPVTAVPAAPLPPVVSKAPDAAPSVSPTESANLPMFRQLVAFFYAKASLNGWIERVPSRTEQEKQVEVCLKYEAMEYKAWAIKAMVQYHVREATGPIHSFRYFDPANWPHQTPMQSALEAEWNRYQNEKKQGPQDAPPPDPEGIKRVNAALSQVFKSMPPSYDVKTANTAYLRRVHFEKQQEYARKRLEWWKSLG